MLPSPALRCKEKSKGGGAYISLLCMYNAQASMDVKENKMGREIKLAHNGWCPATFSLFPFYSQSLGLGHARVNRKMQFIPFSIVPAQHPHRDQIKIGQLLA